MMSFFTRYIKPNSMAIVIAGLFVVAALYRISYFDLWRDEAFSVNVSQKSLSEIVRITSLDVHPPLHLFILHFWMKVFGTSEAAVRMVSVLFYGISVFFAYELAKLVFKDEKFRIISTVFTATTPLILYHAIEARAYSMLVAATVACMYFGIKLLKKPSKADAVEFAIAMIIGLYTHSIFLFALFSLTVWLFFLFLYHNAFSYKKIKKNFASFKFFFFAYLAVGLCFLPWMLHLVQQFLRVSNEGFWIQFHPLEDLLNSFVSFFISDRLAGNMHVITKPVAFFLSTFGIGITVLGAFSRRKETQYFFGFLLFLFLGTVFGISFKTPIYFLRYLVFVMPVISILFTQGLEALEAVLKPKYVTILALLFLAGHVYLYYGNILQNQNLKEHYQDSIKAIAFEKEHDLILHSHGYTLHSYLYYTPEPGYLYDPERKLPHFEGTAAYDDSNYFAGDVNAYKRIWVPYLYKDENFERMLAEQGFVRIQQQEFSGGVHLDLWRKY